MPSARFHRSRAAPLALAALIGACEEKVVLDADPVPPEVRIDAPADSASVSGISFRVEVTATDDTALDRVEFRVGTAEPVLDREPPYSVGVITLGQPGGASLLVQVEAFDAAGNSATASATYTVRPRSVTRLTNHPNDDTDPAWSPDGTRIAFQAKRLGDQFDLWVMDADGSNARQLTANVNEDRHPAWSPDGTRIAFDSDRAGTFDIWLLPLSGGEGAATPLTFGSNDDIEPAWSPDGGEIYFASSRGTNAIFNIWRMPVAGGSAVPVTAFDNDDTSPALSADGSRLAFVSTLNFALPHVYTLELGSGAVSPLTGDVGFGEADPAWAPLGDVVLFSRDDGIDSNLWFQAADDLLPVQATFGSGAFGDGGAAWSPDGTRIAFHSDRDGNLEIYVTE